MEDVDFSRFQHLRLLSLLPNHCRVSRQDSGRCPQPSYYPSWPSCLTGILTLKILGLGDVLIFGDFVLQNRPRYEIVDKNLAVIFGQYRAWPQWIARGLAMSGSFR